MDSGDQFRKPRFELAWPLVQRRLRRRFGLSRVDPRPLLVLQCRLALQGPPGCFQAMQLCC